MQMMMKKKKKGIKEPKSQKIYASPFSVMPQTV
jgi:hypothetical protein